MEKRRVWMIPDGMRVLGLHDRTSTLLLVTHVPIRQGPRGPQIDDQTAAGIVQWCKSFDAVTYVGIAEDVSDKYVSTSVWIDIADLPCAERCEVVALPRAYRAQDMVRTYREVVALLRRQIATHRYLCFTFGGLTGDWPAIAAREAIRQNRPYSAWLDRVEPLIVRSHMKGGTLKYRLFWSAALPLFERNIRFLLRRSSVALLQGRDTFDYYSAYARDPQCTYDTHTTVEDQITPEALAEKQAGILEMRPIDILYVGRAAAMKGPADWLATLELLHRQSVPFRATWIGDGPELAMMQERIVGAGLSAEIRLHGFEGDREVLLKAMRDSDMLLFCHKTPESPRCLIEALVSGCPLVGYETAYPRGLVAAQGGGLFAPQDDVAALSERVADLHRDRRKLAKLVADAAASGRSYNEDAVYGHRAELMKRAVPAPVGQAALAT